MKGEIYMVNMNETANDNMELAKKIFNVYKAAQENDMYIVDRKKSGNFISIYKNIMLSYSDSCIPIERLFKKSAIVTEVRQVYDYSDADKQLVKNIHSFEEYIENLDEEKVSEMERLALKEKSQIYAEKLKNAKPAIQDRDTELYINYLTTEEWAVFSLKEVPDDVLMKYCENCSDFVIHSKQFIDGYINKPTMTVCALNNEDYFDVFVI